MDTEVLSESFVSRLADQAFKDDAQFYAPLLLPVVLYLRVMVWENGCTSPVSWYKSKTGNSIKIFKWISLIFSIR